MCGIVGYIDPNPPEGLLDRQLASIQHRGPDGEGRFIDGSLHMGMRRLSIIDLEGGWQPLTSRGGRVNAFQNGEIYNHINVRTELEALGYQFVTNSDTEVLAHGYDAWGIEGLLSRIDGMYALAIADLDGRVLHLARDRFGEKPLYFAYRPGRFAYASSLKAAAGVQWVDTKINAAALERYLACHFVSGRTTLIEGVNKVLPGERLEIDLDAAKPPRLYRYYRPQLNPTRPGTEEELEHLLEEAVASRLQADVPVGLFLSGGVDSSLIAALAQRQRKDIEAFCIGFDDARVDESQFAAQVADYLGIKLNTYRFDAKKFSILLPTVCHDLDEPIGDQAALPVHWLSHAASKKVKVVLSGEGADEIFGGYAYYAEPIASMPARAGMEFQDAYSAAHDLRGQANGLLVEAAGETQSGFPLITYKHERDALLRMSTRTGDAFERELAAWLTTARDPVQRRGAADLASWLPDDLLVKADRMTMAASIEGRCPFLAPKVVERALSLPPWQKMHGREGKALLRQLARRILPAKVVDRKKQGFVLPMSNWVRDWFDAHGGFDSYVHKGEGLGIDLSALSALYAASRNHNRERLWFALIVLLEWWGGFRQQVSDIR